MDIDKSLLVNIVLLIHMALTGMALIKLFKLKTTTGGVVICSIFALMIPVLGPSGLIVYLQNLYKKQNMNQKSPISQSHNQKKKKK